MRALALALLLALPAQAQDFVARAVPGAVELDLSRRGVLDLTVPVSQPVPWRVFTMSDPPRLVLDTSEVDWTALAPADLPDGVELRTGRVAPGWTRLVLALDGPVSVERAWLDSSAPAIRVEAAPGQGADGPLVQRGWDLPDVTFDVTARPRQTGDRPLVVALDPGHGGVDPGAERRGVTEAGLMLRFAQELAEVLRREGHEVVLTRQVDEFVALRGRPALARAAGADLMISLHADAVAGGGASGATVYTLSDAPADELSAELAARQGSADLLLGVELPEGGDEIAQVLIELARSETAPRSDALADTLVEEIGAAGLALHKRPRLSAAFTVLKAPDIPTVLLEVGFMSSAADFDNLVSPDWRARMATAILRGIETWAIADAADALRLRR
ncbi:MAG: N-acetylmuramoyl-L-alanine amidase [Pseudomonadota bacterium]